jgi:hypothetical protein
MADGNRVKGRGGGGQGRELGASLDHCRGSRVEWNRSGDGAGAAVGAQRNSTSNTCHAINMCNFAYNFCLYALLERHIQMQNTKM